MKKSSQAKKVSAPPEQLTRESVLERLWSALFPDSDVLEGSGSQRFGSSATPNVDNLIPRPVMEQMICCFFYSVHVNATESDVLAAMVPVMRKIEGSHARLEQFEVDHVVALLDLAPLTWMPQLILPEDPVLREYALAELQDELLDCILTDTTPSVLQEPTKALLVQRHATPIYLDSPIKKFVPVEEHRDGLPLAAWQFWQRVTALSAAGTPQRAALAAFVHWFLQLHFKHIPVSRSSVVSNHLFTKHQRRTGELVSRGFFLCCEELCGTYAQRRDAAAYLQELAEYCGSTTPLDLDFGSMDSSLVDVPWERLDMQSLPDLYLSDELRPAVYEQKKHFRHCASRVVLLGGLSSGKTDLGSALSSHLQAVHLNFLDLACAAFAEGDASETGQQVRGLVEKAEPFPLALLASLLRNALGGVRARVEHHGYVFSDTLMPSDEEAQIRLRDEILAPSGLLGEYTPTHFVHLCCGSKVVEEKRQMSRKQCMQERAEAAWSRYRARNEAAQRDQEKAQMIADCDEIIQHLIQLEAKNTTEVTDEELETARNQAAEAAEVRRQLTEEEEVSKGDENAVVAALTPQEESLAGAPEDARSESAEDLRLRIASLIWRGLETAHAVTEKSNVKSTDLEIAAERLWGQSWSDAKLLRRHVSLDAVTTMDSAGCVKYLCKSLLLHRADVATPVGEENVSASRHGTEEYGNVLLAEAGERGQSLSLAWKKSCPVTLQQDGVLVDGSGCFAALYRNHVYCMGSNRKRRDFICNPSKYLRQPPVNYLPLLLIADEEVMSAISMKELAITVGDRLHLTCYKLADYDALLQPRRDEMRGRHAASTTRWAYVEEERKRRAELAAAVGVGKKGGEKGSSKMAPTKPKLKKPSAAGNARVRFSQMASPSSTGSGTTSGESARRRFPRASVLDAPSSVEEEVVARIAEAQSHGRALVPILLYTETASDLDGVVLGSLWEEHVLPENVIALKSTVDQARAPPPSSGNEDDADAGEEKPSDAAAGDAPPSLERLVKILSAAPKPEWRSSAGGLPLSTPPQKFSLHTLAVPPRPWLEDLVQEVMQQVSPAAVTPTPATVDEELGVEDAASNLGEGEDEELLEDDDLESIAAFTTERRANLGDAFSLVEPRKRFLHQFGARLDYCPVTLVEKGLLVRGRADLALHYVDGIYAFASEDCQERFSQNPERYAGPVPPTDVPLRLWMVGVSLSGKKTLAAGVEEEYGVPYFAYDRQFFEEAVEAALSSTGGVVRSVYVPSQRKEENPFLERALNLITELRRCHDEEEQKLRQRREAEQLMEERERREEERANRSTSDDDEDEEQELDEEREALLQEQLEFEPEEEEEKQERLSETYLRIASCVTRIEPFQSKGYIMICPPFSDGDLDILSGEGAMPEAVLKLNMSPENFATRLELLQQRHHYDSVRVLSEEVPPLQDKAKARRQSEAERKLRRWRRRHIGADDPPTPPSEATAQDAGKEGSIRVEEEKMNRDEAATVAEPPVPLWTLGAADAEQARITEEEAIAEFLEGVESRLVDIVQVDGAIAPTALRSVASEALGRHLRYRASLFFSPQVIRFSAAQEMIANGVLNYSSFGVADCVALFAERSGSGVSVAHWKAPGTRIAREENADAVETEATANVAQDQDPRNEEEEVEELSDTDSVMVGELEEKHRLQKLRHAARAALRAARMGPYVYFFDTDANLVEFVKNPVLFVQQAPPPPPLENAPVVTLLEDDRRAADEVGTTAKLRSFAEGVACSLGMRTIAVPSLLAWASQHYAVLGDFGSASVAAAIQGHANAELVHELLQLRLACADVKESGAVLLNLPRTTASYERLRSNPAIAPITQAANLLEGSGSPSGQWAVDVIRSMEEDSSVKVPLPNPASPHDAGNLHAVVHSVRSAYAEHCNASLCSAMAIASPLKGTFHTRAEVAGRLSPYDLYCPYMWVEQQQLVHVSARGDGLDALPTAASYLGHFYFFSSAAYLQRFLQNPTEVADESSLRPLPPALPREERSPVADSDLELEGCCPVLLTDTKDRLGLCGATEPIAKKGSLSCVVAFDGKRYAMLDSAHMERFMREPWRYVEGACLPHELKRPLPLDMSPTDISTHEEYMRRQMYEPVARALLAVSRERPLYPGLSAEESALKFIALFLKASHTEHNTKVQNGQYKENLGTFAAHGSLYKGTKGGSPAVLHGEKATVSAREFCSSFEAASSDKSAISNFNHVRNNSAANKKDFNNRK